MTVSVLTHAPRATRSPRRLGRPRAWHLVVVAALALGSSVVLTGQGPRAAPVGLPDAGPVTAWMVMFSRVGVRIAAVGTVGCLLAAAYLLPAEPAGLSATTRGLARTAARWSVAWALSTVLLMVSSSAQLLGIPLGAALTSYAAWGYVPELAEGRALMLMTPMVLLIAFHAGGARSRRGLQLMLALALLALTPLTLTGHAATAGDHYLATQSLLLHVLAATVWVGGLVGLLHLRRDDVRVVPAVTRFSAVALACFVVVALTGLVSASTRLGRTVDAWASAYGALVLLKLAAFALLGLAGWWHRRRTIPGLTSDRPWLFWRLAGVEVVVMSVAMGLAVALSRTAPPVRAGVVAAPHPASTVDRGLAAVGPVRLLTEWRPEALVVTGIAAVTLLHLAAVWRRIRAGRGGAWAAAGWFVAGSLVLLWALCGGLAAYGSALLSAHVAQLLVCAVVVPRLWARGVGALGIATRDPQAADSWHLPTLSPIDGALVLALGLSAVYATPLLETSLSNGSAHVVVDVAALVVGAAGVSWLGLAAPGDVESRLRGSRLAAGVLVAFGVAMALSRHVFAETWFDALGWSWSDPVTDQRYAALLILGTALLLYAAQGWRSHAHPWPGGTAGRPGTTTAPAAR
jgi:putative copper resistance protein D